MTAAQVHVGAVQCDQMSHIEQNYSKLNQLMSIFDDMNFAT